jgi:CubicO group peptidase (beta-lactamase class C family)
MLQHTANWTTPSLANPENYQLVWASPANPSGDWPVTRQVFVDYWLQLPDGENPTDWTASSQLGLESQEHRYSNFNYELLYDFIDAMSPAGAEDFIRTRVLEPAHMNNTGFGGVNRLADEPSLAEVLMTPGAPAGDPMMYLGDGLPNTPVPSTWPRTPFTGQNLSRSQALPAPGGEFEEFELAPRYVTSAYGAKEQVGTIVRGSGGIVLSALDLARLVSGFRVWRTNVVAFAGYVGAVTPILWLPTTEMMMSPLDPEGNMANDFANSIATGAAFRQVLGWSLLETETVTLDSWGPTSEVGIIGGGNVEGGSALIARGAEGASISIVFSRGDVLFNSQDGLNLMKALTGAGLEKDCFWQECAEGSGGGLGGGGASLC